MGPCGERSRAGGQARGSDGRSPHLEGGGGPSEPGGGLQPPGLKVQDGVLATASGTARHPTGSQFLNHAQHLPAPVAEPAGGHGPLGHTPANTSARTSRTSVFCSVRWVLDPESRHRKGSQGLGCVHCPRVGPGQPPRSSSCPPLGSTGTQPNPPPHQACPRDFLSGSDSWAEAAPRARGGSNHVTLTAEAFPPAEELARKSHSVNGAGRTGSGVGEGGRAGETQEQGGGQKQGHTGRRLRKGRWPRGSAGGR